MDRSAPQIYTITKEIHQPGSLAEIGGALCAELLYVVLYH